LRLEKAAKQHYQPSGIFQERIYQFSAHQKSNIICSNISPSKHREEKQQELNNTGHVTENKLEFRDGFVAK
jgi:hypothetical protein